MKKMMMLALVLCAVGCGAAVEVPPIPTSDTGSSPTDTGPPIAVDTGAADTSPEVAVDAGPSLGCTAYPKEDNTISCSFEAVAGVAYYAEARDSEFGAIVPALVESRVCDLDGCTEFEAVFTEATPTEGRKVRTDVTPRASTRLVTVKWSAW